MTVNELRNSKEYYAHHAALRRGYVSRKSEGTVEDYTGRFGSGYVVLSPRWDTTQYVTVTYYIQKA